MGLGIEKALTLKSECTHPALTFERLTYHRCSQSAMCSFLTRTVSYASSRPLAQTMKLHDWRLSELSLGLWRLNDQTQKGRRQYHFKSFDIQVMNSVAAKVTRDSEWCASLSNPWSHMVLWDYNMGFVKTWYYLVFLHNFPTSGWRGIGRDSLVNHIGSTAQQGSVAQVGML